MSDIKQIYEDLKKRSHFFQSPSENLEFWAEFGQSVFNLYLKDEYLANQKASEAREDARILSGLINPKHKKILKKIIEKYQD